MRFPTPDDVFQIRVALMGIEPPIWRRLLVPQDLTMRQLHAVLQAAMGWKDYHLHQFRVGLLRFGHPDEEDDPGPIDYGRITLNQILPRQGATCVYEYDFGDGWEHMIELEEELAPSSVADPLPRCVDGERACPPEDSRGVPGYGELIAALRDPKDPEHRELVAWAGAGFDPERFDVDAVNRALQRTTRSSGGRRRRPDRS
jgi:hypothetical protein